MGIGGRDARHDADAAPPAADSALVNSLIQAQNADGGWPYRAGSSWTEPTALALLALRGDAACRAGYGWLAGRQRPDGGWPPQAAVDQTTWVTSLVALLPVDVLGAERYGRAIAWILEQTPEDATLWYRIRQRLLGTSAGERNVGWTWFPGTAAWVTPTSLAILALRRFEKHAPAEAVRKRIETGRQFLLSRICADGGWNHGSSRALGYDGESYPETTGVALMALAGVPNLGRNIAAAERHWRQCRSAEAASWLKMGLLAQGRKTEGWPPQAKPRDVRDTALCLLAGMAERGRNAFDESA
jgi:hypothetical protein